MGPQAAVPGRAERAARVAFSLEIQVEVIQVEPSPAEGVGEFVPEFGGLTSPEPDSEAPLATGTEEVATVETGVQASGEPPGAAAVSRRWAGEEEEDSGNTHAFSLSFDPYFDKESIVSRCTVMRETEAHQQVLVPTGQATGVQFAVRLEPDTSSESSTDEEEDVVETAHPPESSEPIPGAATRNQRRARNVAAAGRVTLPTSVARLSADGAFIEGPVTPFGDEALPAVITSIRRWREPRQQPLEEVNGDVPAAEAETAVPAIAEPMAEPDEPEQPDTIPVLSPGELARMSDVAPWVNGLGRPFESYSYTHYAHFVADRHLHSPTGYEPYNEGLGWHDWNNEDRSRTPDAIVLCSQSEWVALTYNYPRQPTAYITLFRLWEDEECARLGIPIHADPRSAFPGRIYMAAVGWRQYHPLPRDLSIHLRHARGPGGTHSRAATNRFGWSPIEHITNLLGYTVEQIVAIVRYDYFHQSGKKRFQLALYEPEVPNPNFPPRLYGIRASSGHSIRWLTFSEVMCQLRPEDCDMLPAMCHGTYWKSIPSILRDGLIARGTARQGRAHVMFSMFPYFGPRCVAGQRYNQWDTIIFSNPRRYSRGLPYYDDDDRRDDHVYMAVAGSLNAGVPVT